MVEVARQSIAPAVKTWIGHRLDGHCRSTTDARPWLMAVSNIFMFLLRCSMSLNSVRYSEVHKFAQAAHLIRHHALCGPCKEATLPQVHM